MTIDTHQIPYLHKVPCDGRAIVLAPYVESDGKVRLLVEKEPDKYLVINPISHVEGGYISASSADPVHDYPLPLSECIARYLSFPKVFHVGNSIEHDLRNSLATLHKHFVLLKHSQVDPSVTTSILICTEIEYALSNHRSLYDRLNEIVRQLWQVMALRRQDGSLKKLPTLPDSFRRVAERPSDVLRDSYFFPPALVSFYTTRLGTFMALRKVRDNVVHHGHSIELVYQMDDGFALSLDRGVSSDLRGLGIWNDRTLKPNQLGSVLALLAFLAQDAFDAAAELARAALELVHAGDAVLRTELRFFYRSRLGKHYHLLQGYRDQPWRHPDEGLAAVHGCSD